MTSNKNYKNMGAQRKGLHDGYIDSRNENEG